MAAREAWAKEQGLTVVDAPAALFAATKIDAKLWPGAAAARLPVLILGLSLDSDPKPKVVRPKTKINFRKGS